ncbi:MAG: hypothetical protein M3067_01965, partial [Chloroflexota bacterium]|nr:hypothetical protein [Chloroflexota bacterium]
DRRLTELAEVPGDPDAARDATSAYRQTLLDIGELVGTDADAADRVEQAIRGQLATIVGLAPRVRPDTRPELDAAADDARATLALLRPVEHRRPAGRNHHGRVDRPDRPDQPDRPRGPDRLDRVDRSDARVDLEVAVVPSMGPAHAATRRRPSQPR